MQDWPSLASGTGTLGVPCPQTVCANTWFTPSTCSPGVWEPVCAEQRTHVTVPPVRTWCWVSVAPWGPHLPRTVTSHFEAIKRALVTPLGEDSGSLRLVSGPAPPASSFGSFCSVPSHYKPRLTGHPSAECWGPPSEFLPLGVVLETLTHFLNKQHLLFILAILV